MATPGFMHALEVVLAWRQTSGWPQADEDSRIAARVLMHWQEQGSPMTVDACLMQQLLEAFEHIHEDGTAPARAMLCRIALEAYLRERG